MMSSPPTGRRASRPISAKTAYAPWWAIQLVSWLVRAARTIGASVVAMAVMAADGSGARGAQSAHAADGAGGGTGERDEPEGVTACEADELAGPAQPEAGGRAAREHRDGDDEHVAALARPVDASDERDRQAEQRRQAEEARGVLERWDAGHCGGGHAGDHAEDDDREARRGQGPPSGRGGARRR